ELPTVTLPQSIVKDAWLRYPPCPIELQSVPLFISPVIKRETAGGWEGLTTCPMLKIVSWEKAPMNAREPMNAKNKAGMTRNTFLDLPLSFVWGLKSMK